MSSTKNEAIFTGGPIDGKPNSVDDESDPIIIEQAGMRMTVAHRQGLGGSDEGLTFDITTAGPEDEEKEFALRLFLQEPSLSRRPLRRRKRGLQDEGRRHRRLRPLDFGTTQD